MKNDNDDLMSQIEKMLNESTHSSRPGDKQEADGPVFSGTYTPDLHRRIEALGDELKDLHINYVFAVAYNFEDEDSGKHEELKSSFFLQSCIEKPVCELIAMVLIAKLPHDFSHLVMDAAEKFYAMYALFGKLFDND